MTCKDCKHFYPLKRRNGKWSYACTVLTGIDPDAFVLEIDGNGLCEMYENGLNLDFKADKITT